jgi:hypothetical protein
MQRSASKGGMYLTLGKRKYKRRELDEQERKDALFVRTHGGPCQRCKRLKLKVSETGRIMGKEKY